MQIMNGSLIRLPKIYFTFVDVRDVADAHIAALKAPSGLRYAVTYETYKLADIAQILNEEFGKFGYKVGFGKFKQS